jgi:hypothetical protein
MYAWLAQPPSSGIIAWSVMYVNRAFINTCRGRRFACGVRSVPFQIQGEVHFARCVIKGFLLDWRGPPLVRFALLILTQWVCLAQVRAPVIWDTTTQNTVIHVSSVRSVFFKNYVGKAVKRATKARTAQFWARPHAVGVRQERLGLSVG